MGESATSLSSQRLGYLVSNPGQFLSEGPGINAFVHAIAFIGGYLSAYVYRYTDGSLTTPNPDNRST